MEKCIDKMINFINNDYMKRIISILIVLIIYPFLSYSQSYEKYDIVKNNFCILIESFKENKINYNFDEIIEIMQIIENIFVIENYSYEFINYNDEINGIEINIENKRFCIFYFPFSETHLSGFYSICQGFIYIDNKKYFISLSDFVEGENIFLVIKEINNETFEYSCTYFYRPNNYEIFIINKYLNIDPNGLEYQQKAYLVETIIRFK
jgi:hypothetical protein